MQYHVDEPIGEAEGAPGFQEVAPNVYEGVNDAAMEGNWELASSEGYVSEQGGSFQRMLISVSRGNGRATVRTNVDLSYSFNNFITGRLSGTIASGSTMSGVDKNNNGIPDALEKAIKDGNVKKVD